MGRKSQANTAAPMQTSATDDFGEGTEIYYLNRAGLEKQYGKRSKISDYTDEELSSAGFNPETIEKIKLKRKLKDTEMKLDDDLKARELEVEKEKGEAASLSLYATQRLKRLETGGRAATMKPILNSGGTPITQNPNRKTLIGV
jgi:hypothetical protein